MASIDQYKSGEAAKAIKLAYMVLQQTSEDHSPDERSLKMIKSQVETLEPARLNLKQAAKLLDWAKIFAVGERICRCEFPGTPLTKSVFLDELADALVEVGKAEYVSKEEALQTLIEQKGPPIIISKASGKYMEICRTLPESCVYWNLEKNGVRCIKRNNPANLCK